MTATPAPSRPGRGSVLHNAAVLGAATIVTRLLMFGFGVVLARALGAEDYGRYALALALGVVLQPVADIGITPYLSREVARDRGVGDRLLPRLLGVKVGLSAATFALTLAAVLLAAGDEGLAAVIAAMALAALLDGISMLAYGYFQGRERMGFEARTTAAAALARAGGGIVLALVTGSLGAVVAWILLVAVLQAAVAALRLRRAAGGARPAAGAGAPARVRWRSVASMGLIAIFVMIYLRVDTVLLGWLQGETAAGLYAAAYTLMLAAQIPPFMLATALTPVFARTHGAERETFAAAWHRGMAAVLLIALPTALGVSLLAGDLIARLYGGEFRASGAVLATIIWICPLGAASLVAQAVLRGAGREVWLTVVSGGCAALNVGLNLWAIPRHGIMGAAVVTVVTESVNVVALMGATLRAGIVPWPRFPALRAGLALAALAAAAVVLGDAPVEVAGLAAAAAYAAVLAATGVLGAAELAALRRLTRRA